ncbi:hypothetical protein GCM10020000_57730 [Streptomyces olivoverticillatus]
MENNYAGDISQNNDPVDVFRARRAAAYRAYWENMPLREACRPNGPDALLYRRFQYGRLAQFDILDTRQYRSDQAYGDGWQYPGPETDDPARTLTGDEQERWLLDGFRASTARWNVIPPASRLLAAEEHDRRPVHALHGRLGRLPGLAGARAGGGAAGRHSQPRRALR